MTTYQFDPTGVLAANKIVGEQHPITAANGKSHHLVVPVYGPFFETGLTVIYRDVGGTDHVLTKGVDYHLAHQFIGASRATVKPIYGSIALLDLQLAGLITIGYQTLGGDWVLDRNVVLAALSDSVRNPRVASWEQVVSVPTLFPPVDHQYNLDDLVGMSEVVSELDQVGQAIAAKPANTVLFDQDVTPTKQRLGLGNVDNFRTATDEEARLAESDTRFVTPRGVNLAVDYRLQSFKVNYIDPLTRATVASTDLDATLRDSHFVITNSNGTGVIIPSVSSSYAGLMTPPLLSKLLNVQEGATAVSVVNDLVTESTSAALSAGQGVVLKNYINNLQSAMSLKLTQAQADTRYVQRVNGITPDASGTVFLDTNIPVPISVPTSATLAQVNTNGRLFCSGNPTLTVNEGLGTTFSCKIYGAFTVNGTATVVDKRVTSVGEMYCELTPTPSENTYWLIGFKN